MKVEKKVGDSNSKSPFIWRKKLDRELADGVFSLEDLCMISSIKDQKRRHKHRLVEVEQLKKNRDESLAKRVQRQEVAEWCNNNNNNTNLQVEEDAECNNSTLTTNSRLPDQLCVMVEKTTCVAAFLSMQEYPPSDVLNHGGGTKKKCKKDGGENTKTIATSASNPTPLLHGVEQV